ncbi:hypothetical protein, partial [Klebsiella sp. K6-322]
DDKPVWLLCPHFCRVAASPYPAYERQQYQTVMRLAVGPRKRSAAGQSLKIARWLMTNLFGYCARISAGWRLRLTRPTKGSNIKPLCGWL